jgi:pimeloyl-ACP methyl ester carboxylesterase
MGLRPSRLRDASGKTCLLTAASVSRGYAVILPGANCSARRYAWLSDGLAEVGISNLTPVIGVKAFGVGEAKRRMRLLSLASAVDTIRLARGLAERLPLIVVGHSLGGALLLEMLDPDEAARNPANGNAGRIEPIPDIAVGIVIGASLQPMVANIALPYRRESVPLHCPEKTTLHFVAAQHDAIANPALMQATALRYRQAPKVDVVAGGNHWGWASGRRPGDGVALDGVATIGEAEQQQHTLALIRSYLENLA